jgi:predicted alpha/beta hydrolase family esterase
MGHSTGGLCVIHAMHQFIDKIKQAFFVAATMLPFGLQTDEDKKDVNAFKLLFIFLYRIARNFLNDTK